MSHIQRTPPLLLLFGGHLHLSLVQVEVGAHLFDGDVRNVQTEFLPSVLFERFLIYLLRNGEVEPEFAPSAEAGLESFSSAAVVNGFIRLTELEKSFDISLDA
jgi:hypothetical protein